MHEGEPLTPLSMAILLTLLDGPRHGYALMQAIEVDTGRRPGTGTLYAALDRLETAGHIAVCAHVEAADPRRQYFEILPRGRAAVRAESARMLAVLDRARRKLVFRTFTALREDR